MSKATVMSQPYSNRAIHHIEAAAVEADDVVLSAEGRVLIAYSYIDAGIEGMYYFIADEIEHAKAAVAINDGETAYWDNGASVFTNVVTANTKCGVFRKDALIGDATANVRLDNTVNL